jgi:hypothetical protein
LTQGTVAFYSPDPNLVPADTNSYYDIFVWDNSGTEPVLINVTQGGNDYSYDPSMSDDGRIIAFWSYASNLGATDDTNGTTSDIFVWDRDADTLVNITDALGADSSSSAPSLSGDGRFIAFESYASNLVSGDNNFSKDIFVFDRNDDSIINITGGGNDSSRGATISDDGNAVLFMSYASNFAVGDQAGTPDVFLWTQGSGITILTAGSTYNNNLEVSISGDGSTAVFMSGADYLSAQQVVDGYKDLFLIDL